MQTPDQAPKPTPSEIIEALQRGLTDGRMGEVTDWLNVEKQLKVQPIEKTVTSISE